MLRDANPVDSPLATCPDINLKVTPSRKGSVMAMVFGMRAICAVAATAGLVAGLSVHPASADYISGELGNAGLYAVLEIGTGNVSIANAGSAGFINGNVGVAGTSGGNFSDSGVPISGVLYFGGSQTANFSGGASAAGGVLNNQSATLSAAATFATTASSMFAGLAPTESYSSTITPAPNGNGVTVVNTSSINLGGGQSLTISGPAGSQFVINDTGGVTLNSGQIVLTGGVTANDVVFNVTSGSFMTSGGLGNESTAAGIFLVPNGQVGLTPGAVTGEIISSQNINIASGGSVAGVPGPTIGAGLPALALLGGFLVAWRLRRGKAEPAFPADA
jgi:hypothetical protein